jgi:hypothetical protein
MQNYFGPNQPLQQPPVPQPQNPPENYPPQQTFQQSEPPKKSKTWLFIILALVIFVAGAYFVYVYFYQGKTGGVPQTGSSAGQVVVVKKQKSNENYLSFKKPSGWLSEPYFPSGTGSPIALFASVADKEKIPLGQATDEMINARVIIGTVLSSKNNSLQYFDKISTSKPDFDKILVQDKTYENGNYRCLQRKSGTLFHIDCWATNGGRLINFSLSTNQTNYNSDVQALYEVIESIKILGK